MIDIDFLNEFDRQVRAAYRAPEQTAQDRSNNEWLLSGPHSVSSKPEREAKDKQQ